MLDNSTVVTYINKQGRTRSISLCRWTKRLLFSRMSYFAQLRCQVQSGPYVLQSPKQSYGSWESEWSLRPSVFQVVIRELGIRVVPTSFSLPSSHSGVGNQSGPYILQSSKQSYGSWESEWSLHPSVFQAVIRELGIRVVPTSFSLPSSHTGVGNQSGPYILQSSKQSYGSWESEWSLHPSVFQAVIRELGIRVVPTSFSLPSSHTGVGNQSGPYILQSSKQSYGSWESEWSLHPSVFQAVIRELGIRVVPTSFSLPSSHTGVGNQSGPYILQSSKQSYGSGESEWSLHHSVFQAVIRELGIRVVPTSFSLPSSHTGVGNQSGPYILQSSKQSYGSWESEWSLHPSVFQAVIRELGIRVVPTSFSLPSSHTGVGNQSGPYILQSSKQSYGSWESEWSLHPSVFQAVIRELGIRVVPTSFSLPSSHTGVGNQSGPYILQSSKQSYGSWESEWSLRPSVFQAVIRELGIRVVPTSFSLPSSHTGVGNQSGPYVLQSSKQSYGSGESEWSLHPSVFQAVIREWGIRVVPTSFSLPSSHTGVGNQSGPYILQSSKQSYGSWESEWSLHPSVFQAVIRELGIPFLDLFATRWNHKLTISIGHGSGCTTNELEGNVGICLPTSSSVTTSSRESPTRLVRTDPHCLTLTTCNLVSTSHRDVGGFPFTDPQHPSITVATTRTNPSRSLQYTVTHMENIRDALGSRGFSVDLASQASRPQRESTLAIYESKWRIFSTWGITQQVNPLSATESVVSDVLLHLHTEKQLAISTIEGYQLAIASTLRATSDVAVGRNPSLKSLLQNIELEQGRCKRTFPEWNVLITLASGKRSGDIHVLNMSISCRPRAGQSYTMTGSVFYVEDKSVGNLQTVPCHDMERYGQRGFSVMAPCLWNDLPIYICVADCLQLFKSQLKTHLFKTAFEDYL